MNPETFSAICHLKALSLTGRCQTFSHDADGYGRSEGSILLLIESVYSGIEEEKDIVARIQSTSMNQDGRSSSLTAPNGSAQVNLLRSACNSAAVNPQNVRAVSTHGTGTALGDPIEVSAILRVFTNEQGFSIMASKSLLGHAEGNAGLNGVLFGVSLVNCDSKAPVQHLRTLNKFISQSITESHTFCHINREQSGMSVEPVLVGSSSFGMSGINAHALFSGAEQTMPVLKSQSVSSQHLALILSECNFF